MTSTLKSITAYVDGNDQAIISCPECGTTRKVSVSQFKADKHTITTRCPCGGRFGVHLNFRQNYRKRVTLPGEFMLATTPAPVWRKMTVSDISRSGIGVQMIGIIKVQPGDVLHVRFQLDNVKKTLLDKKVSIIDVSGTYLRCEFLNLAPEEKELGFYLFSQ